MTLPVQTPVTGREDLPPSEPLGALAEFYSAFNARDLALMEGNWDVQPDIAMNNPLGGIRRGWPEIRAVYARLFEGPARVEVEFFDYVLQDFSGAAFCAVGRERGLLRAGEVSLQLRFRTSRLFRLSEGRYRQVHHHGSIEEPELLMRYREVLG